MENYLHLDAINDALQSVTGFPFAFSLTDDCDVEAKIKHALRWQYRIQRRSIKHWLNEDAANQMTLDRLRDRKGYDEIKEWFVEIACRAG